MFPSTYFPKTYFYGRYFPNPVPGVTQYGGGIYEGSRRKKVLPTDLGYPIVAESLYGNLVDDYGKEEGERIYLLMEREGKGPFKRGAKYSRFRKR